MSRNFDKNKRRPSVSGKRVVARRGKQQENGDAERLEGEDSPSSLVSPEGWLNSTGVHRETGASARIIPIQVGSPAPRAEADLLTGSQDGDASDLPGRPSLPEQPGMQSASGPVAEDAERCDGNSAEGKLHGGEDSIEDGSDPAASASSAEDAPSLTSSQALVAFAAASARAVPNGEAESESRRGWFKGLSARIGETQDSKPDAGSSESDSSAEKPPAASDPVSPAAAAGFRLDASLGGVSAEGSSVRRPRRQRRAELAGLPSIELAGSPSQDDLTTASAEGDAGKSLLCGSEPPKHAVGGEAGSGSSDCEIADRETASCEHAAGDPAASCEDVPERHSEEAGDANAASGPEAVGDEASSSATVPSSADSGGGSSAKRPSAAASVSSRRKRLVPAVSGKKVAVVLAALAVAAILAAVVACFGFGCHLNKSITLQNPELEEALSPAGNGKEPFYTLFAVEYSRTSRYYEGPELLALVRTDPANRTSTVVSIPWNTEVSLSDGKYHPVSEAQVVGGDAYLVASVSQLLNVDIAHFVRTDETGLAKIVDRFGGIEVATGQQVQEPEDAQPAEGEAGEAAGDSAEAAEEGQSAAAEDAQNAEPVQEPESGQTAAKGGKMLDGAAAVEFARSAEESVETRSQNQIAVVEALLRRAVTESGINFVGVIGDLKGDLKTDMTFAQLRSSLGVLAGKEGFTVYSAMLPGEVDGASTEGGYFRDKKGTRLMMAAINESGDPANRDEIGVDKASIFIEVQNGTEINGGAASLREKLRDAGWNVSFIGNNPDTDTPKTLILYDLPETKAAAEEVAKDLGFGTVTQAGDEYQFGTDILVVLGLDGKEPLAGSQGKE